MVEIKVEATLRGLNQVTKNLSDDTLFEIAHKSMQDCLDELQELVVDMTPRDTNRTAEGIYTELEGISIRDLNGRVASPEEHFVVLELGRRPGSRMPPHAPLESWGSRHGFFGRGVIFALRRRIAQRGLPAHHIMQKALARGKSHFPTIFLKRWLQYES